MPFEDMTHRPTGEANEWVLRRRQRGSLTVKDLVRLLAEYPPDLRVVVDGYEGGYDDLSEGQLRKIRIALNVGDAEWVGDHEEPDCVFPKERLSTEIVDALVLRRRS